MKGKTEFRVLVVAMIMENGAPSGEAVAAYVDLWWSRDFCGFLCSRCCYWETKFCKPATKLLISRSPYEQKNIDGYNRINLADFVNRKVCLCFFVHDDRLALEAAYLLLNYSLITLLIRIHKSQLHLLNFDRNSMFLFILLGVTSAIFLYQSVGVLIFLMVIYNRYLLSQNLTFAKTESFLKSILFGTLGVLTLLIYFGAQPDALRFSGNVEIAGAILQANAPVVFFEEFIFRGVLWMALRKINLSERWILVIQTALFGFAHYYFYLQYPVFLFVVIPILGLLFGAMVYRSKSIFLSLIFHFLLNIISNALLR